MEQPEDRGILLRDILETGVCWRDKSYTLDANYYKGGNLTSLEKQSGHRLMAAEPIEPRCVAQRGRYPENPKSRVAGLPTEQMFEAREDGKTNTLTTVQKDNLVAEPVRIGTIENDAKNPTHDSQQYRVYSCDGKSVTLCGNGGGLGAKTGLYAVPYDCDNVIELKRGNTNPVYEVRNGLITVKGKQYPIKLQDGYYIIRKLTVRECMRLQTVPEWYEFPVSDSQSYKMLGNGWTVDVIAHILKGLKEA